jgi:hypothetical protein
LQDVAKRTPLLTLGAIYLGGAILVGLIMVLMGGTAAVGGAMMHSSGPAIFGIFGTLGVFALLVGLAFGVFASVVAYAVPQVTFDNIAPVDAIKRAFSALLQNIAPFLVFGVISFVLAIFASIPMMLGWLVLGPVLTAATYASYKQIFSGGASTSVVS